MRFIWQGLPLVRVVDKRLTATRPEHIIIPIKSIQIPYFMGNKLISVPWTWTTRPNQHPPQTNPTSAATSLRRPQRRPVRACPRRAWARGPGRRDARHRRSRSAQRSAGARLLARRRRRRSRSGCPLLIAAIGSHGTSGQARRRRSRRRPPANRGRRPPPPRARNRAARRAPPRRRPASEEPAGETKPSTSGGKRKLPADHERLADRAVGHQLRSGRRDSPTAAPYITGQLLPAATLLRAGPRSSASAFASEAALVEPPAAGSPPPILHSIVQPPCPEGAAGAGCAPETPGQLAAADDFLKATLATITAHLDLQEHGLVVVTFATVGDRDAVRTPAGASTTAAHLPAAGRRRAALALREGRRALDGGVQPDFTQAEPGKAPALRTKSQHQRTNGDPVARNTTSPPKGTPVAGRDRGLLRPAAREPGDRAKPKNRTPTTTTASAAWRRAAEAGNEAQQVAYSFYCNGPDHRLPAAVAGGDHKRPQPPNVTELEAGQNGPQLGHVLVLGRTPRLRGQLRRRRPKPATRSSPASSGSERSCAPSRASTRC